MLGITKLNAQKLSWFNQKPYYFSYPQNPLPWGTIEYQVVDDITEHNLVGLNSKNEPVIIAPMVSKTLQYTNDVTRKTTYLVAFPQLPSYKTSSDNTAVFSLEVSDIIVSHKRSKIDSIYELYGKANAKIKITHRDVEVYSDTLSFYGVADKVNSQLSYSEFNDKALAIYKENYIVVNTYVLAQFINRLHNLVYTSDMSYQTRNTTFYGMKRTKKLNDPGVVDELVLQIKRFNKNDKGFDNREERNKEVEVIIEKVKNTIESSDYKNHDSYKAFVHGNLGALYGVLDNVPLAIEHYKKAKELEDRDFDFSKGILYLRYEEEKKNNFLQNGEVPKEFAKNYQLVLSTGSVN